MATIKDIADKVGVSMMTVSRAFNDPDKVKEDVKKEIYRVAKSLDYVPNHAAKSLASKKTGVIQIVSNMNPDDYYFTQVFAGAAHYLSEHGYSIMINNQRVGNFQYDGAIFMGLAPGEDKKIYETIKKPLVLFGKSELPIDWVDIDNVQGTKVITEHLIEAGHKNIGFIRVDENESFTQERYDGFVEAMEEHDLRVDSKAVYCIPHSVEGVRQIGDELLKNTKITAYVCETDMIAYALIDLAKEINMKIPGDLSIVGFDGFLYNKMSIPNITTMRQPIYYVGIRLAEVLVERIKNPNGDHQRILIETIFEDGGSVLNINADGN